MRVAIIDDGIDLTRLEHPEVITKVISLVDENEKIRNYGVHGTRCARLLEAKASCYQLVDIKVTPNWQIPCSIHRIQKALEYCVSENIDIICLSAGSSYLSDAKALDDIMESVRKRDILLISALSNSGHLTLPGAYPNAICAISDWNGLLPAGKCAVAEHKVLGKLILANSQLPLNSQLKWMGNSFAVPIVAGWVLSCFMGENKLDIRSQFENCPRISSNFEKWDWGIPAENPVVAIITDNPHWDTVTLLDNFLDIYGLEAVAIDNGCREKDFRIWKHKEIHKSRGDLIVDLDSYMHCSLIFAIYDSKEWEQESFLFDIELHLKFEQVYIFVEQRLIKRFLVFEDFLTKICNAIMKILT